MVDPVPGGDPQGGLEGGGEQPGAYFGIGSLAGCLPPSPSLAASRGVMSAAMARSLPA